MPARATALAWASGALCAGCHHDGCKVAGWGWAWLSEKFDPKRSGRIVTRDYSPLGLAEIVLHAIGADDQGRQQLARYVGDW